MKQILLFIILLFLGCSQSIPPDQPSGFIQLKGSDTMVNASQALAEEFMKKYPYIYVAVTGGGSGVGIASLINQTCDIACASRKIKPKEIKLAQKFGVQPYEVVVAYDAVAVVVNPQNPIEKLTLKQLHDIFTGKIKSWKELGWIDTKIVLLSREVSSGTHLYFKEKVIRLGNKHSKEEFSPQALLLPSSQAIVEEIAQNKGAIGYFGMGYINPQKTKPIKIFSSKYNEYFLPTVENVVNHKYELSRPLFMYTNKKPSGIIKIFIDYVLSKEGQNVFKKAGFVPLKEQ